MKELYYTEKMDTIVNNLDNKALRLQRIKTQVKGAPESMVPNVLRKLDGPGTENRMDLTLKMEGLEG